MTALFFILPVLLLLGAGIKAAVAGSDLQGTKNKFAKLGTIASRSMAEIIAAVGPPSSTSGLPGGKSLLQWQHISQAGGYHIALRFGADGCARASRTSTAASGRARWWKFDDADARVRSAAGEAKWLQKKFAHPNSKFLFILQVASRL